VSPPFNEQMVSCRGACSSKGITLPDQRSACVAGLLDRPMTLERLVSVRASGACAPSRSRLPVEEQAPRHELPAIRIRDMRGGRQSLGFVSRIGTPPQSPKAKPSRSTRVTWLEYAPTSDAGMSNRGKPSKRVISWRTHVRQSICPELHPYQ
jgi:hypothetical protein